VKIFTGDSLRILRTLPTRSVQMCVTSPPYYSLRDYGTATWKGGDPDCSHAQGLLASDKSTLHCGRGPAAYEKTVTVPFRSRCAKCGAVRADKQIGLEETPDQYVAKLVELFREVRRLLRDDGTLWLNLGDSYAGSWGNQGRKETRGTQRQINGPILQNLKPYPVKESNTGRIPPGSGLKPKDLIGIPWRVAFALQADGWTLRSDIIWAKPNPMPESVRDRPTKSHEYLFLLAKSPKYFYDSDAIAEPAARAGKAPGGNKKLDRSRGDSARDMSVPVADRRNKRTVWNITPRKFKGAHFATFPPDLITPCILAGSRPGDTVLDPFSGAGTTVLVAEQLGRNGLGIELNPAYVRMSRARIRAGLAKAA
jgi:DNA modification methylase